jgi:hypothetical protein
VRKQNIPEILPRKEKIALAEPERTNGLNICSKLRKPWSSRPKIVFARLPAYLSKE